MVVTVGRLRTGISFKQIDGEGDVSVDGNEEEEGANGLGPLAGSEDTAGAPALVVDADAVEDYRRLRDRARVCRQLMEELYRVAKVEYDEDGNYDKFKEIEETYYSTITKLDMKFGMFWNCKFP